MVKVVKSFREIFFLAPISVMRTGPIIPDSCAIKKDGTRQPRQPATLAERSCGPHQGHPPTEVGAQLEQAGLDPAREAPEDLFFPSKTPA